MSPHLSAGTTATSACLDAGLRRPLSLPPLHVGVVHVQEHVPAGDAGLQLGADQEGASHLAVERVGLLGGRSEAVAQHDGDEVLDALRGALRAEVEGLGGRERFAEDHHGLDVGVLKGLEGDEKRG